jgi:hypothetical protein
MRLITVMIVLLLKNTRIKINTRKHGSILVTYNLSRTIRRTVASVFQTTVKVTNIMFDWEY